MPRKKTQKKPRPINQYLQVRRQGLLPKKIRIFYVAKRKTIHTIRREKFRALFITRKQLKAVTGTLKNWIV